VTGRDQNRGVLKTKSVHSSIEAGDWLRILATRFRGRGLPADRYDVWMASLVPSERLLKAVHAGKITWRGFSKKYLEEMFAPAATGAGETSIQVQECRARSGFWRRGAGAAGSAGRQAGPALAAALPEFAASR
jgi:uncharacterized protein YeaO (DUF488 family)